MSRSSKTTDFLKECMADALLSLMKTTPIAKITVNRITETAGVGRATWFRNFEDKADAIAFKLTCLWKRWSNERGIASESRLYTPSLAGEFFSFCYSIRDLFALIYKEGQQTAVYDAFYTIIMTRSKEGIAESYRSRFISHGLFGMLNEWIKRDYAESPEFMTKLFFRVILNKGD